MNKHLFSFTLCLLLCACGTTSVIDTSNPKEITSMQNVMELEYRDLTNTAEKMTQSMVNNAKFQTIKYPVIAIGTIVNDTTQRFDTDILTKKIRTSLVNSGKAQITTNFTKEDVTSEQVRTIRNNEEYNKNTIVKQGTLIAPNLSLTGKIIQRNLKLDAGWWSSVDTRVEYYLQLTLTDLQTGLSIWEEEQPIIKEGANAPTW